jgi:hypothetical protein
MLITLKKSFICILLLSSIEAFGAINPNALSSQDNNNAQMVNLNLQLKSRNKVVKSNLTMPFYQTAEVERSVGDKNVLIEFNPRRGKNSGEIALDMKLYRNGGGRPFYKKDFIAKVNEHSIINLRGLSVKVMPIL